MRKVEITSFLWYNKAHDKEVEMRRHLLIGGSIMVLVLLAFLGGMKLGQAEMYEQLVFGDENNEILVKVSYGEESIFVRRFRDDNIISILDPGNKLDLKLSGIKGLENYKWQNNELILVKIDTIRWEEIIKDVFQVIFGE
jgi:hypothetical protein